MKQMLLGAAFVCGSATTSAALEYMCQVRDKGDGFMSPVIALQFEPGAKSAFINDAYINYMHKKPIKAKMKDLGGGKYRVSYRLNKIPAQPRPISINYTVTVDTNNKSVAVRGMATGVLNSFAGVGQCQEGLVQQ